MRRAVLRSKDEQLQLKKICRGSEGRSASEDEAKSDDLVGRTWCRVCGGEGEVSVWLGERATPSGLTWCAGPLM